jgi:multiple sugar transport system ATP-binding protein
MAEVKLTKISKIYPGGFQAVREVDLTIADQEFVVLVGPSGCGKSTTLRMIAGLEDISSGELHIGQRLVNHVPPKDRDIAMVFQSYALYPHMSVQQNLAFGLQRRRNHRSKARRLVSPSYRQAAQQEDASLQERVGQAAQMLGLQDLLERKPGELSGGQRQRVAVGRAIVRDPKAFLFDEPLSNLDAKLRVEMRTEIKRLHREMAATTIYVTHDQEEAMTLGDRLVVMKEGVIHQIGSPTEVYEKPANRFVASFVGTPPMNFFEGKLAAQLITDLAPDLSAQLAANLALGPVPDNAHDLASDPTPGLGTDIVLGLRPDAIFPQSPADSGTSDTPDDSGVPNALNAGDTAKAVPFSARLITAENLGDRTDLMLELADGTRATCRTQVQANWRDDSPINLIADLSRAHYFAPGENGLRIDPFAD